MGGYPTSSIDVPVVALLTQGWEERNQVHDVLAEKWSDTILGKERLYDPDTGDVYRFDLGFREEYETNREKHRLQDLRPLAEDAYDLWMQPPLDGEPHLQLANTTCAMV